jgi:hypothetical protein
MRRRELLLMASATMGARVVRAQQKAMPAIGYLMGGSPGPVAPLVAAFRQGLSETGYVEGQNVAIEFRAAEGHYDRSPALAADLVDRKVDVILAGNDPAALAAKSATSTIPIVFASAGDPVQLGLVASSTGRAATSLSSNERSCHPFGRPGCALNRPTWSPVKGSSARVSPNRLSYGCPTTIFGDPTTDTDIISAQHFWTGGLETAGPGCYDAVAIA